MPHQLLGAITERDNFDILPSEFVKILYIEEEEMLLFLSIPTSILL